MSNLNIPLDQIAFEEVGATSPSNAGDTGLLSSITIAGLTCHLEAYQVRKDNKTNRLETVNDEYAEALDALYVLSGANLSTTTIKGKQYVIAVYPYST